ncbi:MAG: sigma-70 family RNA polymerase sigma factor [Actinobacteria bacterium]|nr:sigma-70 family RNA polymerase sigma factor [Actinomycetota bacterium]MCL5883369.1 sigma-70 family RNA polymerase sigma factor [Actinomycetota bacterium]
MEHLVPTDDELIAEIRQGKAEALETLVSRYETRVYNLSYKMLGNKQDAEDVLQDTFLNVVRSLDSFKSRSSFSTWLYRVATNAALTKLRQRSRRDKSESEFLDEVYSIKDAAHAESRLVDWSDRPAQQLLDDEAKRVMEEAIEELPEIYRVVFVLRDVQGLPATEVAEVLDLSVPAVKSRLHRARLFLRNRLSDYFTVGAG